MRFDQAYDPVRSTQASWEALKRTPLTIVLGALAPMMVQYALAFGLEFLMLPFVFMFAADPSKHAGVPWFLPAFIVLVIGLGIVLFVFQSWIDIGYARAIRAALATNAEQFGTIFRGTDRLGTILLARLLVFLVAVAGYLLAACALLVLGVLGTTEAPGLLKLGAVFGVIFILWCAMVYVLLGFQFVTPIVALEDCSATEAIGRSWRLAAGHRWRLILFWLFLALLVFAGCLACGLGILIAVPLIETMRVEAYLALTQAKQPPPAESFASPA